MEDVLPLHALILHNQGAVAAPAFGLGQRSAAQNAARIGQKHQNEQAPHHALKLPPSPLKLQVFSDRHRAVDLRHIVADCLELRRL